MKKNDLRFSFTEVDPFVTLIRNILPFCAIFFSPPLPNSLSHSRLDLTFACCQQQNTEVYTGEYIFNILNVLTFQ